MTFFSKFRELLRIRRVCKEIARSPGLTEEAMNAALQLPSDHPLWRTLIQLLNTAIDNAYDLAGASIMETNRMAGYVGGAQHLIMFRDELVRRREAGIQQSRPTRPTE